MYLAAGSNYETDLFNFGVKIDALSPLKLLLVLATFGASERNGLNGV